MKAIYVDNNTALPENETTIITRREIIPLLAKARQVLRHYEMAMGCSAMVLDSSGKKQTRFCAFCIKHFNDPSQVYKGNECPCWKIHQAALAESRRTEGVYVYSCTAGFVYWTSPLYRNGRYAGALIAGQVMESGNKAVPEKFKKLCKDNDAEKKISAMIESVPEKKHEEIKAMAEMLGLCAEEISERREDPCEMIRRKAWQSVTPKTFGEKSSGERKIGETPKNPAKINKEPPGDVYSEYPPEGNSIPEGFRRGFLEKERMLFAAFRRGDNETGGKILKELMNSILTAMPGNLELVRYRAIELIVLLSRAAISGSSGGEPRQANDDREALAASGSDALLEINNRYLNRILESKTAEELIENLHLGAERMASKIFSFQGMRHASALRRAERYIWENYTRKLSLDEIAKASGLSAPYFSTIFKEEMGENLSSYLNRLRIERTLTLLTETGKPLNEIAKLCGFEDQSWFSKIFKSFTGMSPGKFRENGGGTSELKPGKNQANGEITFRPAASGQARWRMPDWSKTEMLSS